MFLSADLYFYFKMVTKKNEKNKLQIKNWTQYW